MEFIRCITEYPDIMGNPDLELALLGDIIESMFNEELLDIDIKEITNAIYRKFQAKTLKMMGYDISNIDVELIDRYSIAEFMLKYVGKPFGIKTFDMLRNAYYKFAPMEVAKAWALENNIINISQWSKNKNRPANLPSNPLQTYKCTKEEFFGVKTRFVAMEVAKAWAREHDIINMYQWRRMDNRPINLPADPLITYKCTKEEFFGIKTPFAPMRVAKAWAIEHNIINIYQWIRIKNRPDNLPAQPLLFYKCTKEEFFGTPARIQNTTFATMEVAKAWAREHNIKNPGQWIKTKNRPANFPVYPLKTYKCTKEEFFGTIE
jgi:hypothetical protein